VKRLIPFVSLLAVLASAGHLAAPLSHAHEHRDVGEYSLVVGFLTEPALAGEPNGLELRVSRHAEGASPQGEEEHADEEEAGTPVEGLESTLQAEVIVGGGAETMPLELEPRFGQPGAYVAHFIPTRAGDYSFRIFGTIEGMEIDEVFDSGPETFSPVNDTADLQFPDKVPSAAQLDEAVRRLEQRLVALEASGSDEGRANLAVGLGIAGLVAGAGGLVTGFVALARARR
jgi:hypothetical protein